MLPGSGRADEPHVGGAEHIVAVSSGNGPQIELLQPDGRSRVVYRGLEAEEAFIDGLSFSPAGTELAFTEGGGNPSHALVVLNLLSGRAVQIPTAHLTATSPSFLRDGRIVFSGGREGVDRQGGTYSVRPDGSGLRRLFGRRELAAASDGSSFVATDPHGNFRSLFLLDRRGYIVRRIAGPSPKHTEDLDPSFSPNGKLIVYTEEHFLGTEAHGTLYLVRRDGSHRIRLTFGPESATEASFSPDGRHIIFARSPGRAGGSLFILSAAEPRKTRKIGLSAGYQSPAWGP
jgi:TolB protein